MGGQSSDHEEGLIPGREKGKEGGVSRKSLGLRLFLENFGQSNGQSLSSCDPLEECCF